MVDLNNLIYQSFKNEIALEKHIATKLPNAGGFFPFKVFQFSSFFSKPNYFYKASILLLCLTIFLFQIITVFLFLFLFLFRCIIVNRPPKNIIVSSITYRDLMNDSVEQLNLPKNDFFYINILSLILYVKKDRLLKYLIFLIGYTRYVIVNSNEYFILFLNYKDILKSYMLSVYILDNPEVVVLTEDHYQRFAFIISNLKGDNLHEMKKENINDEIMNNLRKKYYRPTQ